MNAKVCRVTCIVHPGGEPCKGCEAHFYLGQGRLGRAGEVGVACCYVRLVYQVMNP